MILRAFEKGADGVMLVGCTPEECHYEFGNHRAEEMFAVASKLVRLLGYSDKRLQMERIAAGDGATWVEKIQSFTVGLNGNRGAS